MSDADVAELAARRRRWGCIRAVALATMVLTVFLTLIFIAAGSSDETTETVPLADASFDVTMLRLADEPVAVIRNGGQVQVLRLVLPDGEEVGWCENAEVFVAPESGSIFDLDGVKVTGAAPAGLERFDFLLDDQEIEIDLSAIEPGAGDGTPPLVSSSEPALQACLTDGPVVFAPAE